MWRRSLGLGVLITTSVVLAGPNPAEAAIGIHKAIFTSVAPTTTTQLDTLARIFASRLGRLGASFVHVAVSHHDIIMSSTSRAMSMTLLDEVGQFAQLYFRPMLCFAPPFESSGTKVASGTAVLPACTSADAATVANIGVTPNSSVQSYSVNNNLQADPQFAFIKNTPTTASNYPSRSVLLPALNATKDSTRYVLGPSEMTGHSIGSATAQLDQTGNWVVNYRMAGSKGSTLWDSVAQKNFHRYLAIELDGVVRSAPLIQPAESVFSSFDGQGEISGGNMTESEAKQLARAITFGALPVHVALISTES